MHQLVNHILSVVHPVRGRRQHRHGRAVGHPANRQRRISAPRLPGHAATVHLPRIVLQSSNQRLLLLQPVPARQQHAMSIRTPTEAKDNNHSIRPGTTALGPPGNPSPARRPPPPCTDLRCSSKEWRSSLSSAAGLEANPTRGTPPLLAIRQRAAGCGSQQQVMRLTATTDCVHSVLCAVKGPIQRWRALRWGYRRKGRTRCSVRFM